MKPLRYLFPALCLLPLGLTRAQEHGHLNVGAVAEAQGAQLRFDNGPDFARASDYVKTLTYTNSGPVAGYYQGNITLTALHSLDPFGDVVPGGLAPGSFIVARIVSVSGPPGGEFEFWETNSIGEPAVRLPVGTTNSTFAYALSQANLGAGEPGADPFGHIHGRRFTATKPGIYSVGFQALDISTNGPGGAPIHTPSDVLVVVFEADVNLVKVEPEVDHARVTFAAPLGYTWQLESKETLSDPSWVAVGDVIPGNDKFVEVEDDRPLEPSRFYRAVGTPAAPP